MQRNKTNSFNPWKSSFFETGYWRLEYDIAATNALTGIISKNFVIKSETAQLIEHKRWQSASYLSKLPSLIGAKNGVGTVIQNENDLNMNMDRMFRDSYDQYNACVIDYLVFDRVNETFWTSLSKKSRMEDALRHISSSIGMKHISMDRSKDAFTHAAASALAHLQLGKLYIISFTSYIIAIKIVLPNRIFFL